MIWGDAPQSRTTLHLVCKTMEWSLWSPNLNILVIYVSKGLCMREIQNDLLFSYCLIYTLNGLIDVPGSYRQQRLFLKKCFKENGLQTGVYQHRKSALPHWYAFIMSSF